MGKTVANIFALFFSQPSEIHVLPGGVDSGKVLCLCTVYSRYRQTDGQTNGKSDLITAAFTTRVKTLRRRTKTETVEHDRS